MRRGRRRGDGPVGGGGGSDKGSPVEEYLDRLLAQAPGPPREVRALLAEAEAHLRDATAAGVAEGLDPLEAQRRAVQRFGPVRSVARAEAQRQALTLATLGRQVTASALLLGAIGGLAIGVSGLIAAVLGAVKGSTFIVNISSSTHLAPSDCARWLAQDRAAHSCYQAALYDWTGEVVGFRLAAGVMGAAALAAYFLLRRRWARGLPSVVVDTVAVTLFGLSGVWLLGLGVDWVAVGTNGAGQWLSAAPVALAVAAFFGVRLLRDLRRPPPLLG